MNLKNIPFLSPFQYRDFRYLFFSEICFYIPAWMAVMVFGLIATHLKGNSPFYVGLVGFGFNLPMLLGPFIGIIVGRYQRSKILKIASIIAMIAAIVMASILIKGWPNFWLMFLIVLIYGFCAAFYYPAILTYAHDIIDDPKIVGNGISLVNSTNRIMMFFGYGLGGFLVTYFSEQSTFWFNAILYFLSFLFLIRMFTQVKLPEEKKSALAELKSGFTYIKNSPPVFAIVIMLSITGLLVWPYLFQIPVVNRYYLHGTPATLGFLLAIGGVGGTVGALLMSARKSSLRLNRIFLISMVLLAFSLILLALCRSVFWATPVLFLLDFCLIVSLTVGIIFVQQVMPKEYIGQIMGVISMVSFGTIPIGSVIFYGGIGEPFGIMTAFFIAGIILLLAALWYIKQLPKIRQYAAPIFVEKGLLKNINELNKI